MTRYATFAVELSGALDAARALSDVPAQILRAQQRALATVRRRLPPEAKRDVGAEYNLRPSRIAEGLSARNEADGIRLIGKSRGINAIEFGARWTRVRGHGVVATVSRARFTAVRFGGRLRGATGEGARWAVRRGEAPAVHAGSFIARGKNGVQLVFQRQGTKRLPIEGLYGPSVGQMLKHGRRPERLAEYAIRILQSEQVRLLRSPT